MKLTKDEIQFIDSYLKKEGIIYADIRYEMVDHIACAVEEKMEAQKASFNFAFKAFMAATRKEIMKRSGKWFLSLAEAKRFIGFLFKPQMLVVLAVFLGLNYFFKDLKIIEENQKYFKIGIFWTIGIIGFFQFIFFRVILKKRFYYVEKTGQILALIYLLNMVIINPFSKSTATNNYFYILLIYLVIGYICFSVNQITSFYHLKMNRI